MNYLFTARKLESNDISYKELSEYELEIEQKCVSGTGAFDNPYKMKFCVKNAGAEVWNGVIHIELEEEINEPSFFLPGFMYGRNRGEAPQHTPVEFPRMREGELNKPSSSWWMIRGDRLASPVALIYGDNKIFGFHASPYWISKDGKRQQYHGDKGEFYRYSGYSCRIGHESAVGYTLGYENAPWLFIESHDVREREELTKENCISLNPGEGIDFEMFVYEYVAGQETDVHKAFMDTYRFYHEAPRKLVAEGQTKEQRIKEAICDISRPISEYAWLADEKSYSGFVYDDLSLNKIGSLTWTNGLSVAVPILLSAIHLNDENMRSQALTCIQNIMDNCMNALSGLPYEAVTDGKWSNHGWWFDGMRTPGHTGYLTGQAMYYILKAYENEKEKKKVIHEDWLSFVRPVLAKVEKEKNSECEYPFVFSEYTGAGLEYDSFGGCWCMAAVAYYTWLTKDMSYLEGIRASEKHYYEHYVAKVECYGAPLDTAKAVDSEGILAYIRAVRYLHMLTGETVYLAHMKDALDYEFTFKFCYNSPINVPPLNIIGWSSCGGSITSTCNPHIHPMSSTIVGEMAYYVQQTGDEYVKSRMEDTIWWGCQTYNTYDKEYGYGKKGWMSERFCYSQGLVKEKYPDGTLAGTWFALMPWAGASILEGLVESL